MCYFSACEKVYYLQGHLEESVTASEGVVNKYNDSGLIAEMTLEPHLIKHITISLAENPVDLGHMVLELLEIQKDVTVMVYLEISEADFPLYETLVSCFYFIQGRNQFQKGCT